MVAEKSRNQAKAKTGIMSYLEKHGLGNVPLANIIYFLRDLEKEGKNLQISEFHADGKAGNGNRLRLYLAEEQQIYREAFQSFFVTHPLIELVGSSDDTSSEFLTEAAATLAPEILVLGVKTLQPSTMEKLESIRESCPDVAIVLLSAYYDIKGIKALREFSRGSSVGCAYLLKHTIDTVEQLTQVISSVGEGRIILDPAVMDGMLNGAESYGTIIKEISPREMDVLSWMAKGYRNDTIADVLCLEVKTVERHINSIYSKLGSSDSSRHPRVNAILSYLSATGLLPTQQLAEA